MSPSGMRLCLVAHGFPPHERAGVENYTAALAAAFARAGVDVQVFAPRSEQRLPDLCLRREERDGYRITWLNVLTRPSDPAEALDPPQLADRFAEWLDVERPDVVHLQHAVKLGLGFAERAAARGLPVIYTAHDYYAICHRFTLLRPDLARCDRIGDAEACTRCDLATAVLNALPELGDYHLGVDPAALPEAERARLLAVLDGDEAASGFAAEEWRLARERRQALDRRRQRAFAALDVVLAPTRFLADRLIAGGVPAERVEVLPYGIDVRPLAAARAVERPRRPLRIGYAGSLTKHKGVHVLLDAFARLAPEAELHVHGDSTDRVHVERMSARAAEVGARWHGAYEASDLPRVLSRVDVLVVPSIWVENQPLAIREAFAAGVPVVASDVGALPESVRDGVDGLLVPPGDPDALAAALRRLIDEPDLYARLRAGLPEVKDVDTQVRELLAVYERARRVSASRRPVPAPPLPHLADVAARHAECVALPLDALFERVLEGLERLGDGLGAPRESLARRTFRAFGGASKAREFLRDMRTERQWHEAQVANLERALAAAREKCAWLEQHIANDRVALDARAAEARWREEHIAGLEKERDWLREERERLAEEKRKERRWLDERHAASEARDAWRAEQVGGLAAERDWLREQIGTRDAALEWLRGEVANRDQAIEWLREQVAGLERELGWRRETQAYLEKERQWLLQHTDAQAAQFERLRAALAQPGADRDEAERRLAAWDRARTERIAALEAELARAAERAALGEAELLRVQRGLAAAHVDGDALPPAAVDGDGLASSGGLGALVERIARELQWRRAEMRAAGDDAHRGRARHLLVRTRLGRRARGWREVEPRTCGAAEGGGG